MYRETAKFILYRDADKNSILNELGNIFEDLHYIRGSEEHLKSRVYEQIKRLLTLATKYGFGKNIWQAYLTYIIVNDENPFSLSCEKRGQIAGTINEFALNDFSVFKRLFDFDFSQIEEKLHINCFSMLAQYQPLSGCDVCPERDIGVLIGRLSEKIAAAKDEHDLFALVCDFYSSYGVGSFGLYKAFRLESDKAGEATIVPVPNMESVDLDDLIGYDSQKKALVENTEAFIGGKGGNNVLLYGDSGTGKSTSIRAIVNRYYDGGLRMIEVYKHQFLQIPRMLSQIKNRNYKFIIYMDDLSFEDNEVEYKYLKALIEGGVESRPNNVLIYATSNRRHLIKEMLSDRNDFSTDTDLHRSESVEEKLSLANRFGLSIGYFKPTREEFDHMVLELAERNGISCDSEKLLQAAHRWEMRNGGISGRTAQQFISQLRTNTNCQ